MAYESDAGAGKAQRRWASTVTQAAAEAEALCLAATMASDAGSAGELTTPPPPAETDRFDVVGLVGEGGMGRVLEVRDRQFGRVVALKEMTARTLSVPALRRFVLESVVTANLEHPGIVPVYERGVRDGAPYYAMRRLRGRSLREQLAAARTTDERCKLLPAVVQVAHTLGFAHERGVVHRDVKPDNVLVGDHGEAIVLDWGLCKLLDVEGQEAVRGEAVPAELALDATQDGSVLGTPAYLAPEQALGALDDIDARTDVFALGALLFEVLTGRPPYTGPTVAAALAAAVECRHPRVAELAPETPPELVAIVERAMARRPQERFADAAELARALEGFQARALAPRESRLVHALTAAIAVGCLLLLTLGAALTVNVLPSLRQQGTGAVAVMVLAFLGLCLSAIEWRTLGRYTLSSLALAASAATAALGVAYSISGLVRLFGALEDVAADGARFRGLLAMGFFEALGAASTGLVLAAFQVLIWALVRRAVERRRARSTLAGDLDRG